MEYQLALEKAVLEYAASLKSRQQQAPVARVRIPGFMDDHVWAMAATLGDQGYLVVSVPSDEHGLGITKIEEAGANRLKEIIHEEEKEAEESRLKAAASNGQQRDRKWWQKLLGRKGVTN